MFPKYGESKGGEVIGSPHPKIIPTGREEEKILLTTACGQDLSYFTTGTSLTCVFGACASTVLSGKPLPARFLFNLHDPLTLV